MPSANGVGAVLSGALLHPASPVKKSPVLGSLWSAGKISYKSEQVFSAPPAPAPQLPAGQFSHTYPYAVAVIWTILMTVPPSPTIQPATASAPTVTLVG